MTTNGNLLHKAAIRACWLRQGQSTQYEARLLLQIPQINQSNSTRWPILSPVFTIPPMQTPVQIHRGAVVSAPNPSPSARRYSPQMQYDTAPTRWLKQASAILSLALIASLHAQSSPAQDALPSPIV